MTIGSDLLALVERINDRVTLPGVRQVWIPEPAMAADRDAEFGVVELDDGAAGLFYAWLGDSQTGMASRYGANAFAGNPAIMLARYFGGEDDIARSVGLAAINAITQSLFARAGYEPPAAVDSMAGLELRPGDHLGMVGNFPSLVRQARAAGVPVTVVERKQHMLHESADCVITLDPTRLGSCNKIICTAATLINDSIDEMLTYCRGADVVAVLGPSASFPPDPLFARGITIVGGSRISNAVAAIASQRRGEGLRHCSHRYVLRRSDWPGIDTLLDRVRARR